MLAVVKPGQDAVTVDSDLGVLHGHHHGVFHRRVHEAGDTWLRRREDKTDTRPADAEAEQSPYGGVGVDAVAVDDGII